MVKIHTSFARNTELKNWLFMVVVGVFLMASSCDKNDDAPFYSDADRARCAHIDRDADLGEYLYSVCLCCPYPTTVTPGPPTQDGGLPVEGLPNGRQGVFTGWINDTIAFQSWNPRSLPDEYAVATVHFKRDGTPQRHRTIWSAWSTWNEIDSLSVGVVLSLFEDGSFESYEVTRSWLKLTDFGPLTGQYALDSTEHSIIITRWDDQVVSGTIDAWFYDPDEPSRRIHFSDGWFDVGVKP